jgi:hypothetical protein
MFTASVGWARAACTAHAGKRPGTGGCRGARALPPRQRPGAAAYLGKAWHAVERPVSMRKFARDPFYRALGSRTEKFVLNLICTVGEILIFF